MAPPQRPPVFLMSAMSDLIRSAYSSPRGRRQNFSPEICERGVEFRIGGVVVGEGAGVDVAEGDDEAPVRVAASMRWVAPSWRA